MPKICFLQPSEEQLADKSAEKLYLSLVLPISDDDRPEHADHAVDQGMYQCVGYVDAKDVEDAWQIVQNLDTPHSLHARSMMVGDVVGFEVNHSAFLILGIGSVELPREIAEKFLNLQ